MASIRKRGNTYQIRSSCGYDIHGKQVVRTMTWKPTEGMTARQIDKEVKRQAVLFDEQCAAQGKGSGNIKFEAFAMQWFKEYAEPNLRAKTVEQYHKLEPRTYAAIGHIRLDKLTARQIQAFVSSMEEDGQNQKTGGKLAAGTIRRYVHLISSILEYAVKMELIQSNPCRRVTLPPMEHKEKEVYTLEEAKQFLDSLETAPLRYQAFFTMAVFGGFRRGELLGLEWQDIDFDAQTVAVRRTSQYTKEKGIYTDTTKTRGSQRTVKLPPCVFTTLRRYRAEQAEQRLLLGDRWTAGDRLFTTSEGKPLYPSSPRVWLERFCEKTGQRCLGIHAFRHLSASLLIGSGADVRTAAAVLGHSRASTTLDIYAHSFETAQDRACEIMDALLGSGRTAAK